MAELSKLCRIGDLDLVREAEVSSLGFVDIELEHRLVFAKTEEFAALADTAPGISAVLVSTELSDFGWRDGLGVATAPEPDRAFVRLHNHLATKTDFYETANVNDIDPGAEIHPKAHIDKHGVVIGPDCRVGAGAVVLQGSKLGHGVHIMPGAVIGGSGFQTLGTEAGMIDVEHAGSVVIGDGTTVMANAVIARAVFRQATVIGKDCRIGNGAFVSHNCRVGSHCLIGHGAVVAGNTEVGTHAVIGPGAVLIDRITVGDGANVTAGAVVTRSVAPGQRVSGNFASEHSDFIRALKERGTS